MQRGEIRPLFPPSKPLYRWSLKLAWLMTSGTSTPVQNFLSIWLVVFALPVSARVMTLLVIFFLGGRGFFLFSTSKPPAPSFTPLEAGCWIGKSGSGIPNMGSPATRYLQATWTWPIQILDRAPAAKSMFAVFRAQRTCLVAENVVLPRWAPAYLADDCLLTSDVSTRRLRSTDTATCVVRRSDNSFGDRCFAAAGPRQWNMLPVHLRQCDSLGQFKRLLKTHLFVFGTAAHCDALVRSAV